MAEQAAARGVSLAQHEDRVEAFLSRHRDPAYRLALRILGSPEMAEDATQDALVRAYRSLDRLASSEAEVSWVRRIVVRCSLTAISKKPKTVVMDEPSENPDYALHLAVRQALARLEPEQRALLALATGEGLSYREISETLGVPEGTVGSRLHAAKAAFKRVWEES